MKRIKSVSRIFELILGIAGAILSLASGSLIIMFGDGGLFTTSLYVLCSVLGAFLGIFASIHVFKDSDVAGFLFIVSSILVLLESSDYGTIGAILLLAAGISALFRK